MKSLNLLQYSQVSYYQFILFYSKVLAIHWHCVCIQFILPLLIVLIVSFTVVLVTWFLINNNLAIFYISPYTAKRGPALKSATIPVWNSRYIYNSILPIFICYFCFKLKYLSFRSSCYKIFSRFPFIVQ